jgi:hypothetical protein
MGRNSAIPGGEKMNVNEKIALYEYCRSRVGKEFYNLSDKRKESVKRQYLGLEAVRHPAVKARWN